MSDPPPFERNGCTARRPLFEVTVPKHTRDFPHTNTHTHKHTHRPLPCLLTLIPLHLFVFLTSCQKRPSESSGRDQRPDLVIGQDGEETDDCVFTTAWVHLPICVCLTHTCYSHAYSEYEYVHHGLCLNQVFSLGLPHTGTCIHIHTLLHSSSL